MADKEWDFTGSPGRFSDGEKVTTNGKPGVILASRAHYQHGPSYDVALLEFDPVTEERVVIRNVADADIQKR